MSEAALEEVSVLSSIYCGGGEFQLLQQSAQDGLMVQINSTVGGERRLDVSLLFHLHPSYPSCPPAISVSSTVLSRTQCHNIRQKLLDQAAALPPEEPMVHQLVEWMQQCVEVTDGCRGAEEDVKKEREKEEWTAMLVVGPHPIEKSLHQSAGALDPAPAAHWEVITGKEYTGYSAGRQSQHQGVLSPFKDGEGGCGFFRQEMQREDDEGSH
ncbi:hypothetical protein ABVT39_006924 [Epinephelus coioides]